MEYQPWFSNSTSRKSYLAFKNTTTSSQLFVRPNQIPRITVIEVNDMKICLSLQSRTSHVNRMDKTINSMEPQQRPKQPKSSDDSVCGIVAQSSFGLVYLGKDAKPAQFPW
jgi:hypothetical protein